jgi:hypothetical protein
MVVCRQALALESFSTLKPSLGHPAPCRLACRIARELGHLLAIGDVSQKFISRILSSQRQALLSIERGQQAPIGSLWTTIVDHIKFCNWTIERGPP